MEKLEKVVDEEQKKEIRKIGKNIKQNYKSLDKELVKLFKKYEQEGKINYSQLVYDGKQIELEYKIAIENIKLYAKIQQATAEALKSVIENTDKSFKNMASGGLIPGIKADIRTDHLINKEMAGLNWKQRSNGARDKFIGDLQRLIKEGLEQGKRYETMSKEIAEEYSIAMNKASRIVRTESHRVLNDRKLESLQKINQTTPIKKKWLSMGDERVREGHSELDGVTIGINEEFESPLGGSGQAPGLMNNAADDIHCRCIMTMVIQGGKYE